MVSQGWHYFFYRGVKCKCSMRLALFISAAVFAVAWAVGFFVFSAGMLIHVCMITAALLLMQAIIINPAPKIVTDPNKAL